MKSATVLAVVASLMASADAFPFQSKEQEPKHFNPRLARRQWFFGSNTSSVVDSESPSISETELYTQQAPASSPPVANTPEASPEVPSAPSAAPSPASVVTESFHVSEVVSSYTSIETTVIVIPSVASSEPVASPPVASSPVVAVPEPSSAPSLPVEQPSAPEPSVSEVPSQTTTELTSRQLSSSRFDGLFSSWFDDVTSGQSWLTSFNSSQSATPRPTTPGAGVPSSHRGPPGNSETTHDTTNRGPSRDSSSPVVFAPYSSSTVAAPAPASSPSSAGTSSSASEPSSAVAASSTESSDTAVTTVIVASSATSVGSTVTVGEVTETQSTPTEDTKTLITETTPIGETTSVASSESATTEAATPSAETATPSVETATTSSVASSSAVPSTPVVAPVPPVSSAGPVVSSGGAGVLSSVLPFTDTEETSTVAETATTESTATGTASTESTATPETATTESTTATPVAPTSFAETTSSSASVVVPPPVSHQSGMSQFTSVLPFTDTESETSVEETSTEVSSSSTEVIPPVVPTTETSSTVEPTSTVVSNPSEIPVSSGAGFTSVIGWSDTETTETPTATSEPVPIETSSSEVLTSAAVPSTALVAPTQPTISSVLSGMSSVAPWSPSETETATESSVVESSSSEVTAVPVIPTTTASPTEEAASASAIPSHASSDLGFSSVEPYIPPTTTESSETVAPSSEVIHSAATTVDLLTSSTAEAPAAVSTPVSSGDAFSSVSPYIPEASTESLAVVSQESSLEVVSQVVPTTTAEEAAAASSTMAAGMLPVSSYSADEPFTSVLGPSVDASSRVSEITAVVQSSTAAGDAAQATSGVSEAPAGVESSAVVSGSTVVAGTASPAVTSATEVAAAPSGTTSETSNWFPAAIVTQSASSTLEAGAEFTSGDAVATATATPTASGIPSSLPKIIAPSDGFPDSPKDSTLIQIGFTYALNYPFIVNNPVSVAQIFHYLPEGVGFGLGVDAENVSMRNIQPYDSASAGYIVSLALAYIPSDQVSTLTALLHTPTSKLYRNPDSSIQTLMNLIDPSIPLIPGSETISSPGNGLEGVNGNANGAKSGQAGSAGSGGDGSDKNNGNKKADAGGGAGGTNPYGSIDTSGATSSTPVDRKTVGIAVGAIVGAFAYGGAIFLVSKRYRKKKTMALDSSDSGSSVRSRYFDDTESSNFDVASVPSRSHTHHSPAMNNQRSFVPRAQISQPVMSENSLGWT